MHQLQMTDEEFREKIKWVDGKNDLKIKIPMSVLKPIYDEATRRDENLGEICDIALEKLEPAIMDMKNPIPEYVVYQAAERDWYVCRRARILNGDLVLAERVDSYGTGH